MSLLEETKEVFRKALEELIADVEKVRGKPPEERKKWEIPMLVVRGAMKLVRIADELLRDPQQKKEAVKEVLVDFWMEHMAPIDIRFIPNWCEAALDRYIAPMLISFAIEMVVGLTRHGLLLPEPATAEEGQ